MKQQEEKKEEKCVHLSDNQFFNDGKMTFCHLIRDYMTVEDCNKCDSKEIDPEAKKPEGEKEVKIEIKGHKNEMCADFKERTCPGFQYDNMYGGKCSIYNKKLEYVDGERDLIHHLRCEDCLKYNGKPIPVNQPEGEKCNKCGKQVARVGRVENICRCPERLPNGDWDWKRGKEPVKSDEGVEENLYDIIFFYIDGLMKARRILTEFYPEDLKLIINGICERIQKRETELRQSISREVVGEVEKLLPERFTKEDIKEIEDKKLWVTAAECLRQNQIIDELKQKLKEVTQ